MSRDERAKFKAEIAELKAKLVWHEDETARLKAHIEALKIQCEGYEAQFHAAVAVQRKHIHRLLGHVPTLAIENANGEWKLAASKSTIAG